MHCLVQKTLYIALFIRRFVSGFCWDSELHPHIVLPTSWPSLCWSKPTFWRSLLQYVFVSRTCGLSRTVACHPGWDSLEELGRWDGAQWMGQGWPCQYSNRERWSWYKVGAVQSGCDVKLVLQFYFIRKQLEVLDFLPCPACHKILTVLFVAMGHTLVISTWVTCPYESPNDRNGFPLPYILWTENDLVFWVRSLETKWMISE